MDISWYGDASIQLKHEGATCWLNPPKGSKASAELFVYDSTDEKHASPESGTKIDWPGEYDISGFSFQGYENIGKKGTGVIAYTFHSPQGNIAWVGEMSMYPTEQFLETLGEIHVLIVPVGGDDVLAAKDAFKLVEALEPLVVIPVCHGGKREGLQAFLKEMDVKMPECQKKFTLKRSGLENEQQMDLIILDEQKA